jgi:hypothetical protein
MATDKGRKGRRGRKPKEIEVEEQPVVATEAPPPPAEKTEQPKLAPVFRVITLPKELWEDVKANVGKDGASTREIIRHALDGYLPVLVDGLSDLGLRGDIKCDKRIRASLDADILGKLHAASTQCGLPMTTLLVLALMRYTGR